MSVNNSENHTKEQQAEVTQELIRRDRAAIRKKRLRALIVFLAIALAVALYFLIPKVIVPAIQREITYNELVNHPEDLHVGDVIVFGDNEVNDTWIVLDIVDSKVLLLNEKSVIDVPYVDIYLESTGKSYDLYEWLDEIYYELVFNDKEKALITETDGQNVFLLSSQDVLYYFDRRHDRIAKDQYDMDSSWWLAPLDDTKFYENHQYVDRKGNIDLKGSNPSLRIGVRPAVWLDLG